jgi:hypothetical protein
MEDNWIADLLKLMVSRKILSVLVMTIVVGSLLAIVMSKAARAEDEREDDDRYEKESSEKEYENEKEDEERDNDWDLSSDFAKQETEPPKIVKEIKVIRTVQMPIVNLTENLTAPVDITLPELNETQYMDYDNDTIINKYDKYPGQNDLMYMDSDKDGTSDAIDRFPGKNDLDFEDNNHNGIADSKEDS